MRTVADRMVQVCCFSIVFRLFVVDLLSVLASLGRNCNLESSLGFVEFFHSSRQLVGAR